MTPGRYAKILAVAADERGDPATRAAAQKQIDKWRVKMEGVAPEKKQHPGMVQSDDASGGPRTWKRGIAVAVSDTAYLDAMDEVLFMVLEFVEQARYSDDDVALVESYLKMASRSLRCALKSMVIAWRENRAAMEQRSKVKWRLSI